MDRMDNVAIARSLLYYTYSIVPIIAGIDKFFYYIANWSVYLNPFFTQALNMTHERINMGVGIIEIVAGILVFIRPKIGAPIVACWLVAIALELALMGTYYDIAIRDIGLAVGAMALALLSY